jgi:hypothetical protein
MFINEIHHKKFALILISTILLWYKLFVDLNIKPITFIREWTPDSTLSINDFKRVKNLFFKPNFDAEIFTTINYIKKNDQYVIKTFIEQDKSVYNLNYPSNHLLKHEKYHANISSYFAKIIQKSIEKTPPQNKDEFLKIFNTKVFSLHELNDKYDLETNHCQNLVEQNYWEYKIDSLHMSIDGAYIDKYSGIKVNFPISKKKIEYNIFFNSLKENKFDIELMFSINFDDYINNFSLDKFIEHNKLVVKRTILKHLQNKKIKITTTICSDSANFFTYKFINIKGYNLSLDAYTKNHNGKGKKSLSNISNKFLNSFSITNLDNYWYSILKKKNEPKTYKEDFKKYNYRITQHPLKNYKPFIKNNKLIIPIKKHLKYKTTQLFCFFELKKLIIQELDSSNNQIICIDLNKHNIKKVGKIHFGICTDNKFLMGEIYNFKKEQLRIN